MYRRQHQDASAASCLAAMVSDLDLDPNPGLLLQSLACDLDMTLTMPDFHPYLEDLCAVHATGVGCTLHGSSGKKHYQ